jgi:hypothetical protein
MNLDITQQTVLNLVSGTLFSYPIKLSDGLDCGGMTTLGSDLMSFS